MKAVMTLAKKKPVGIDELLGHALGCVGLSLDDFCRLTPGEFEAVCKAWHDLHEDEMRDSWERMRMSATIGIQPHIKGKITPEKLLPFPWEKSKKRPSHPRCRLKRRGRGMRGWWEAVQRPSLPQPLFPAALRSCKNARAHHKIVIVY